MTTARLPAACVLAAATAAAAHAGVVYQQNFENPGAIGSEWSSASTESHSAFTRFTSRRTNQSVTLTLDTVNGQMYSMVFDLYLFDSWDGGNAQWGQDRFNVKIDGAMAFSELLDNQMNSPNSTYRNPDVVDYLAFGNRDADRDSIYRAIALDFTATGESTTFAFFGSGLQGKSDESWGIDNVSVAAIPTPAGAALLGAGGLLLARRRR
ncbi:MAG: hypothetical protein ACTS27_09910 [Phycisphaerales bacterium]